MTSPPSEKDPVGRRPKIHYNSYADRHRELWALTATMVATLLAACVFSLFE